MMRFIVFIIVLCVIASLCSCTSGSNVDGTGNEYGLRLVEVDGCEYVFYNGFNRSAMVHHGNCHNPVHRFVMEDTLAMKSYWRKPNQ